MPAEVLADPLRIACVFTDGSSAEFMLDELVNPMLGEALLTGLAAKVHPHGEIDRPTTVRAHVYAIRDAVTDLAVRGHTGGVEALTRARLIEYLWSAAYGHESAVRTMLAAYDRETGVLPDAVRELVNGRPFSRVRETTPLEPYGESEWLALQDAARKEIASAWAAHRRAWRIADTGRDPRLHGWTRENLYWFLAQHGPRHAPQYAELVGWSRRHWDYRTSRGMREEQHEGVSMIRGALFPTTPTTLAYVILFSTYTGMVPDGVAGLELGDIDWAGDTTALLDYLKGRTRPESLTLSRKASKVLERWLEHSAALRRFAPDQLREDLWLRFQIGGRTGSWTSSVSSQGTLQRWVEDRAIVDDAGQSIDMHRHRIRTTFEARREKGAWFGSRRATIDPNHSPGVEGNHYLAAVTAEERDARESIIEEAQQDLLRKAQPPVVLASAGVAELVDGFPEMVTRLGLDADELAELVGGERDVFVAACGDQLSGLHGPKGQPCPARPWVCLLCPLALFTPAHGANLLRLKAYFSRQWQQMPAEHFMAVFGRYSHRIEEVLRGFDAAVVHAAAQRVADTDEELPLLPEERTR